MQAMALTQTSIGKKVIMALTGAIWIGFVVFHMYGNLKVFGGALYFNTYSEGLRELGAPIFGHSHLLWVARVVLLGSVAAHVWAAVSLYQGARTARPHSYAMQRVVQANYPAVTMRWGGLLIFLFIIYHLMHFTLGTPGVHNEFIHGDPYHNLVVGFRSVPAVIFYLLALTALALHLYHGAWSLFQTLGLNDQKTDRAWRGMALLLAIVVPIGFAVVPLSVLLGLVR